MGLVTQRREFIISIHISCRNVHVIVLLVCRSRTNRQQILVEKISPMCAVILHAICRKYHAEAVAAVAVSAAGVVNVIFYQNFEQVLKKTKQKLVR